MDGQDEDTGDERCLVRQGFWKKFVILAGGSFMNLLTGIVIIAILFAGASSFYVDQASGFSEGFPLEGENGLMVGAMQVSASFLTNLRFIGYQTLDFVQQMWFSII